MIDFTLDKFISNKELPYLYNSFNAEKPIETAYNLTQLSKKKESIAIAIVNGSLMLAKPKETKEDVMSRYIKTHHDDNAFAQQQDETIKEFYDKRRNQIPNFLPNYSPYWSQTLMMPQSVQSNTPADIAVFWGRMLQQRAAHPSQITTDLIQETARDLQHAFKPSVIQMSALFLSKTWVYGHIFSGVISDSNVLSTPVKMPVRSQGRGM